MKVNIKNAVFAVLTAATLLVSAGGSAYALSAADGANAARDPDQQSACLFDDGSDACKGQTPLFQTITNVLLFIVGAVSVVMLIIGGIKYTVSQGDSAAITSAKNTILYAIVGIVVALLAYAAVSFVIGNFAKSAEDSTTSLGSNLG